MRETSTRSLAQRLPQLCCPPAAYCFGICKGLESIELSGSILSAVLASARGRLWGACVLAAAGSLECVPNEPFSLSRPESVSFTVSLLVLGGLSQSGSCGLSQSVSDVFHLSAAPAQRECH